MTKEDVYKIIGYHGDYNINVKKAIRKLLKENHPDNKGDQKRFELINEVKEELENGKVSIKISTKEETSKTDDIDYEYCKKMIKQTEVLKNKLIQEYENKNKELQKIEKEYRDVYRKNVDLELNLLTSSEEMKKIKLVKDISVIMLVFLMLIFTLSIMNDSIVFLIIFVLLAIICVIVIQKYFVLFNQLTNKNKIKFKKYVGTNNTIRNNVSKQEELSEEIHQLKKKINNLDNDLRFYDNLLK